MFYSVLNYNSTSWASRASRMSPPVGASMFDAMAYDSIILMSHVLHSLVQTKYSASNFLRALRGASGIQGASGVMNFNNGTRVKLKFDVYNTMSARRGSAVSVQRVGEYAVGNTAGRGS